MKTYGEIAVTLHSFLTLALDATEVDFLFHMLYLRFPLQEVHWDPEPILKDLKLENSLQPPGINSQYSSSLSFVSMFTLYVARILLIILYFV